MEYTLICSRRKTLVITFDDDGNIVVKAPVKTSVRVIEDFLRQKEKWIAARQEMIRNTAQKRREFSLQEGDIVYFLGKAHKIAYSEEKRFYFTQNELIMPNIPFERAKPYIISLYRKTAKKVFSERAEYFSALTGLKAEHIGVTDADRRWGSCSGKNRVNFAWKLVTGDIELIDYVVVHELCHTVHHDHSKRFWALVESVLPDYKKRRAGLKTLQKRLEGENWES